MMTHKYSRLSLLSLLVACALLAACNAPPPPQPLELPVTLGFFDDANGLRLVLTTANYYNGGGAIAYAADISHEFGEGIDIELLGVQPCPTQYPPWPARACPAAEMPATAEIALDNLPRAGTYPLILTAAEYTENMELYVDPLAIHLHDAADSRIFIPRLEAAYMPEEDSYYWQRLRDLELPVTVGFVDDARGLRMTLATAPVTGGGTISYTIDLPSAPGGELRLDLLGLRPCMMDCPVIALPVQAEIALDDLPHGEYTLLAETDEAQEGLNLEIGDYDIILRPDTNNGVVVANPDAAYVPNRYSRGDGLYHWRRLQPDTVWIALSYSGVAGGQLPSARDRAEFWEQIAVVQEGLDAAEDLEALGMIEAYYAHPNFVTLWSRYPMPSYLQATNEVIPVQVTYYRHTGSWDAFVARVESLIYSNNVDVGLYNFQGDVMSPARRAGTVRPASPLSPAP